MVMQFITYNGSIHNQLTIYAHSTSFAPFESVAVVTIPVTTVDGEMEYVFDLDSLDFDGELADLGFTIAVNGYDAITPHVPTPTQPTFTAVSRCAVELPVNWK